MMEPKAKWKRISSDVWRAQVGPFRLEAIVTDGECQIADAETYAQLWFQKVATPCDVTDLMRLTEAELARRLTGAAETMDGAELVPGDETGTGTMHSLGMVKTTPGEWGRIVEQADAPDLTFRGDVFTAPPGVIATTDVDAAAYAETRFKVGDKVTAKPFTRLRDTMIAAVGTIDHVHANGTVVVEFGTRASVTCFPRDLERYETEQPRFRVGDLVRCRDENEVGTVEVIRRTGLAKVAIVQFKNCSMHRAVSALELYTLPPINSYADLANVLDELPEGVVVEVLPPETPNVLYRRILQSYEYSRPEWFAGWRRSDLNNPARLTTPTLPTTKFRIVPPAEVEK